MFTVLVNAHKYSSFKLISNTSFSNVAQLVLTTKTPALQCLSAVTLSLRVKLQMRATEYTPNKRIQLV